jgi:branched-chain amino acid transport system substrate-binding protein
MSKNSETATLSRRAVLAKAGIGGTLALSGCLAGSDGEDGGDGGDGDSSDGSDGGDGSSDGGDGGSTNGDGGSSLSGETVTYGVVNPMTGPYGALASTQRKGAKLGIQHVNDSDEFDFEIEGVYDDTEASSSTGRQAAQQILQQEDASYLMGAISSSVALGLNDLAKSEEVIYNPGGAAIPITGSKCNEYVFRFETNTAQIAQATAPWAVENLGTNVWYHIADYAYGKSVLKEWQSRMETASGFSVVGTSRAQLGASNFGSYISQIANSDADVAVLGMTGGDLVRFLTQAHRQGLKDSVDLACTTADFRVVRAGAGKAAAGVYTGVRYDPAIETGDNQAFVDAYQSKFGSAPDNFARVAYESIRMTARGIQKAGTTDPTKVKDVLAGMKMQTIFGENRFRTCDHQAVNPVWVGKNTMPDSGKMPQTELIEQVEGGEAIPSCDSMGCSLS